MTQCCVQSSASSACSCAVTAQAWTQAQGTALGLNSTHTKHVIKAKPESLVFKLALYHFYHCDSKRNRRTSWQIELKQ